MRKVKRKYYALTDTPDKHTRTYNAILTQYWNKPGGKVLFSSKDMVPALYHVTFTSGAAREGYFVWTRKKNKGSVAAYIYALDRPLDRRYNARVGLNQFYVLTFKPVCTKE
jgi:hypothetical protein